MNNETINANPVEIYLLGNVANLRRMFYIAVALPFLMIPIWIWVVFGVYDRDYAEVLGILDTCGLQLSVGPVCAIICTILLKKRNDETIYIIENKIPIIKVYNDRLLYMDRKGWLRRVDFRQLDTAYRTILFSEVSYFDTKEEKKYSKSGSTTYDYLCNAGESLFQIDSGMSISPNELLLLLNKKHTAYQQNK